MPDLCFDLRQPFHQMAGGIGANWHAIGPHAFWYDGLIGRRNRTSRGSAWGGNPPVTHEQAWRDILRHALWLGFNFFRIEIDTRMFEPERRRFDFTNSEMLGLYRQLEHCQRHGVEVFLTHQHQDVAWNAHPGISRVQSSPRSVADFAHGLVTLVKHLIHKKGYTCVKWLCLSNEPGFDGCWWIGADGKPDSVMPALRAVRKALDRSGLSDLPISGPDWCNLRQDSTDFDRDDPSVGCFDGHQYGTTVDVDALATWSARAKAKAYRGKVGVPFFLSEFGAWVGDHPFHDDADPFEPSLRSYDAQLTNACRVIQGLAVGVDGFNRWSFTNRGDLDGQFQLVRTWDAQRWQYLKRVEPEPVPYHSYGIISRFLPKHAHLYRVETNSSDLVAAAVGRPGVGGGLSVFVLNASQRPQTVSVVPQGLKSSRQFHLYQVSEKTFAKPPVELDPLLSVRVPPGGKLTVKLPPRSISTVSTWRRQHSQPGVI